MFRIGRIVTLFAAMFGSCFGAWAVDESIQERRQEETVVLLHGMGRGRASLWVLDMRLKQAGFKTASFPYVTHARSLDQLSTDLVKFIRENVKTPRYHLIAHSLGNVIVRNAFKYDMPPGLGRIVMLAPPNRPAELARALKDNPIYRWVTGESGQQLASDEFYAALPVPNVEFGIIAGNRGQTITLKEPTDGVITVESTKLKSMRDWTTVHQAHTFIMNARQTARLCAQFLDYGNFDLPQEGENAAQEDRESDVPESIDVVVQETDRDD